MVTLVDVGHDAALDFNAQHRVWDTSLAGGEAMGSGGMLALVQQRSGSSFVCG